MHQRITDGSVEVLAASESPRTLTQVTNDASAKTTEPDPTSRTIAEIFESTLDLIETVENEADTEPGSGRLVPTGFADLDNLLGGGLWPGHLTVLGGRPGAGSSVLGLNIARTAAVDHGMPTLVMCTDTSAEELNIRILAAQGRIPVNHIRNGLMSTEEWDRLARWTERLAAAPLHFNTEPAVTVARVTEAVENLTGRGLRLLVLDGLQSLDQEIPRDSRYFDVCDDVHALKRLARTHGIPIVVVSKLNRVPEQRLSKRPMLHDLRNAGDIEDVADEVVMIHREDMYESESLRPGEADLDVVKNRHGATRLITVAFQGHYARFVDMKS